MRGARGTWQLISLCTVEILIIGLHWGDIGRVLFEILIVIQSMSYLVIHGLSDLLRAYVVDELGSGLDADLGLDLPDKGVRVDSALVEPLVHIV